MKINFARLFFSVTFVRPDNCIKTVNQCLMFKVQEFNEITFQMVFCTRFKQQVGMQNDYDSFGLKAAFFLFVIFMCKMLDSIASFVV